MTAEADEALGRPSTAADRTRQLAGSLRRLATAVGDAVDGGAVLVFAAAPGESDAARLRAAAGFAEPREAKRAADALLPQVREVLEAEEERRIEPPPSLRERAAGGVSILPLCFEGRVRGALAVGSAQPPGSDTEPELACLAELLAMRLDHAHLEQALAEAGGEGEEVGEERSEEILRLSEALFAQDIELLRSNEKLGKIEKLKNDFIEKMSRELRTPLNSIIEAIISVLTGENEALSDSAKATLRSALDEGTAFLRTLQNILDLWRIKQAELPVELQDVNLREVVDEAIFSVQDTLADKPVSVEPEIDEPFPKFRTDLAKLSQILFLLLDNAAKFTPRGRVVIRARLEDERLGCEIEDSGIGICQDDQQLVFDEFFQVDEPSSQKYRGAGLGLALVRDLVVLLGGELSVSSDAGQGTTFRFEIPVQTTG